MNITLVREILDLIVSYDRSPFPDGAVRAWLPVLDDIDYEDARQAVIEHYTSLGARDGRGEVRRIVPADVRARAAATREARERVLGMSRPKLPAGRVGSTGRPARVEQLLREARDRVARAETERAAAVRAQMLHSVAA